MNVCSEREAEWSEQESVRSWSCCRKLRGLVSSGWTLPVPQDVDQSESTAVNQTLHHQQRVEQPQQLHLPLRPGPGRQRRLCWRCRWWSRLCWSHLCWSRLWWRRRCWSCRCWISTNHWKNPEVRLSPHMSFQNLVFQFEGRTSLNFSFMFTFYKAVTQTPKFTLRQTLLALRCFVACTQMFWVYVSSSFSFSSWSRCFCSRETSALRLLFATNLSKCPDQ